MKKIKEIVTGAYDPTTSKIKLPVMITVQGGPFLMGTSDEDITRLQLKESEWAYEWSDNDLFESEQPQHTLTLPTFEIAQNPVTNAEYFFFTWETGYRLPRGWMGIRYADETGNHPVTGVSRLDADAYIKWLNERTRLHYRLPTEAEWERAARGDDGRIFPWGNTFDPWRCNTAESAKRGTTPVGFYSPGGDSMCGCVDMVGNVWEWTSSILAPYPYIAGDGREERKPGARYVIRGGGWYYTRKLARCAAREGMLQDHLSPSIGFRLAHTPE
jgi:formylglycine-generating enzyme required for sulfatase activity